MVGACLACLLRELPLKVALVDRAAFDDGLIPCQQDQPAFDPRVSALTPASKRLFTELGVLQAIEGRRSCAYLDMEVWDADGTGRVHFSAADINQPELGSIVENSVITRALHEAVKSIGNLQIIAPARIDDLHIDTDGNPPRARLLFSDRPELSAALLVAADGANSSIRELAAFKTREWDYNHQAIVTTVKTELPHEQTARQRFIDTGPLAFLPLLPAADSADQHFCSIVWSAIPQRAEQLMALSDAAFKLELAAGIEHKLGKITWLDQRFAFPLRQRHATDYVRDNVVLIGDAAHTIHPLAGQGVNLGLLDAAALAGELSRGLGAGRELADQAALKRYQRKRIGHNLGMMWVMEGFRHLFAQQALPIRWLRNIGMTGVDNLSLIKNQLARRAMGLDW